MTICITKDCHHFAVPTCSTDHDHEVPIYESGDSGDSSSSGKVEGSIMDKVSHISGNTEKKR